MRGVTNITTVPEEEGVMEDHPVQLLVDDLVLIMVVHAALCMIGTTGQHMIDEGVLIMVGLGVLNMVDIAGIAFVVIDF